MKGSYRLDSFTENKETEVSRLKAQVELFFDKEFSIFQSFGLKDGMTIIECGSGPGYLIKSILKKLPASKAYALEIDPYLFEILTRNSEDEGKKLYSPMQGSIYSIDLPDESVDFVVTRLVVEHLQEPMKAFKELRRILKPNGTLVVVSNDFAYHVLTYPVIPELDEMFDAYNRSRFAEGGNPLVGRQLPVLFEHAGFSGIGVETTTAHSKLVGDQAMLSAENVNISRSLVKEGFLKAETLENLLDKWFKMLHDPNHIIYRQLFIVGGKKDTNLTPDFTEIVPSSAFSDSAKASTQKKTAALAGNADLEEILLKLWKDSIKNNAITASDNFFEVGGHSLLIPEILGKLEEEYGLKAKIMDFFQYPTVKSLAALLEKNILTSSDDHSGENEEVLAESYSEGNDPGISAPGSSNQQNQSIRFRDNGSLDKMKAQREKFKSRRNKT